MKMKRFSVILAVLILAILAIGAVSAESIDDADLSAAADATDAVSIDDSINDVSVETTDKDVKNSLSAVALGDDEEVSYEINDTSYSTYFNDNGTAKDVLSTDGDYTLNIGTITNKDIKIESGSNINIIAKENEGFITNGTIVIGDYEGDAASIIISGLTFNNTNKNAVDILDYSNDITVKENDISILGISSESTDQFFSVYGVNANGFISGLYIEDNNISIKGDAIYSYGIQLGSYAAMATPEDILISGNTIDMDISEGSNMAEAIYLDNPYDATIEDNVVTVKTVGDTFAYGIQISDSAAWTMWDESYDEEGELTSAQNVLIQNNMFTLDSEYMIYGITVIDSGADCYEKSLTSFELNITIDNNTVVAKSTRGLMGIAGQVYNMTVTNNKVFAFGGSAEGVSAMDALGNDSYALGVQYNGATSSVDYYVVVKDNILFTNITEEFLNSESFRSRVTFENNIAYDLYVINDDTYPIFFNEDGTSTGVLPEEGGYDLIIDSINDKDIKIESGSNINIIAKEGSGIINNGTIDLGYGDVSGIAINGLTINNLNKNAINLNGYLKDIEIDGNDITVNGDGDAYYLYGIMAMSYGALANPSNIAITNNNISMDMNAGSMAEAMYISNPDGLLVENNNVTVDTTGDVFAYGIQVADDAQYVYMSSGYSGTITSPKNILIKGNEFDLSSEYMIYGITAISFGADGYDESYVDMGFDMPLYYASELNTTVTENRVVAKSTKGVIGIAGQIYNMTVTSNNVTVEGGDIDGLSTYDTLGIDTYAIGVQYNAGGSEKDYYVIVKDNIITTDVDGEFINDDDYLEFVTFDNLPIDLSIEMDVSNDSITVGETTSITLTVENLGPCMATDVLVAYELDSAFELVEAVEGYNGTAWTIGDLLSGETAELVLNIKAINNGTFASTATVSTVKEESDDTNNKAEATIIVNEEAKIVIDDSNYDTYFDENGYILNTSGIAEGDLIYISELTNKNLVIDMPLNIEGATGNKLVNTTISLVEGADGSNITGLYMEFTGDENSGGFAVLSAFEVNNITIENNIIRILDSKGSGYAMAIEVEGLEVGCDSVAIMSNDIEFLGSTAGMYGIDVFTKWKSDAVVTHLFIYDNVVCIEGATATAEPLYLNNVNNAVVYDNIFIANGGEGATTYGIGASTANNLVIEENLIQVNGTGMTFGISSTKSENGTFSNNTIVAEGTGAIGIGLADDSRFGVIHNNVTIIGGDYTTASTWDSVGVGNGAIVDRDGTNTIENNTIREICPPTITDDNYDTYFDESGYVKNTSGIKDGDLIFIGELTNKNIVLDVSLDIKGAPENNLVNTTITVLNEASGTLITGLNFEFTGDNTTGSVAIIYVLGASDVEISDNFIVVNDFVDKAGAKYGSSLYAIEVESGADGSSYINIYNNNIDVSGSSRYLYGIDVFQTWGSENANSYISITENVITIDPASRMAEGIYASGIENAVIANNTIISEGDAAAYGIGTDTLTDSTIADNNIEVRAGTQAYGITNTYSSNVDIYNNTIVSKGIGAVGVGFTGSEGVEVTDNTIEITGEDYTSITSSDTLGTANAAILDKDNAGTVANNTITENCPITITDDNYASYFDEDGKIKNTSGIKADDLVFIGELTNKDLVIDMPLDIKGAPGNTLVNTTIALVDGADGTIVEALNFEYEDDGSATFAIISVNDGVSNVVISDNNITAVCAPSWNYNMAISLYGSAEGSENISIVDNVINMAGDAGGLYGIDAQNYDPNWNKGKGTTDLIIRENEINIFGIGMVEPIYISNCNDVLVSNNIITSSSSGGDAYAIGTSANSNLTIIENNMEVVSENNMAYGVASPDSTDVVIDNNTIFAQGVGAVGIGFVSDKNIEVVGNYINITGDDYTTIRTYEKLGTANAAILNKSGNSGVKISNNTIVENCPITIDDSNYAKYFDNDGNIKNTSGLKEGDLVFIDKLTNKNLVIDMPLDIKGIPGNELVNTTIALKDGADGTTVEELNFNYNDNGSAVFAIISVNDGVSNVMIADNNITTVSAPGWNYNMAISLYGSTNGSENITIMGNTITMSGDAGGLYGIDAQNYDPNWNKGKGVSDLIITDNVITIDGSGMVEPIYIASCNDVLVYDNVIKSSSTGADAYAIGTSANKNLTITDNDMEVVSKNNMAYGVASPDSTNVVIDNNTIVATGVGSVGVGFVNDKNVEVIGNNITINGGDYTAISTYEKLGTANAAILNKSGNTGVKVNKNNITENCPIIIDDSNYDTYFDEDGYINENCSIKAGDTLLIGELSGKNMVIDIPVTIEGAAVNKLTNSTIAVVEGGDGTVIDGLNIEFTGDETTGSVGLIYVNGASDVTISNNNITVPDFVNKDGAKYGSSLYAIEVESGATGTDNITITGNNIEINGSANYLYGIDVFTTWGANTTNSNVTIEDNKVVINGGSKMAEAIYVSDSKDVTIKGNDLEANAVDAGYGIATDRLTNAEISGNEIGVSGSVGYGITSTTSGKNVTIDSNDVMVVGTSAIGIGLSDQNGVVVKDNNVDIIGGDYGSVSSRDSLGTANAAILDKDNKNVNLTLKNNTLYENGKLVNDTHSGNSSAELQAIIDAAKPGSIVDLDGVLYSGISDVVIDKNLTITNGTIAGKAGEAIFVIPAKSEGGPDKVNITGMEFLVNNGSVIVKATADNGTSPASIDTPAISIAGNLIDVASYDTVPESVTILELDSERGVLAPTSEISVKGNNITSGIDPFEFKVTGVTDDSGNTVISDGGNVPERTPTVLHYSDMNTTAVNSKIDGRIGKYFNVTLTDINGNPLVNREVQIGFNGRIYNKTTDANGLAQLQINLGYKGTYTFAVSYLGDDAYNASFVVAKITVSTQKTTLKTASKSYKSTAKTKTLTATLTGTSGKGISGKTVKFTVNGKTYSAKTNTKGVATVKVSLSTKKTYSFTAKFAGDTMYTSSSVKGKVTIK